MAHHLAEMIGKKGKVFIETTNPDVSSVVERVEGFKEGMSEYPDVEIVENMTWMFRKKLSSRWPLPCRPIPIFGTNLYSAQGACQAVVNAGLTGAVKIASWDATEDLIKALKEDKVDLILAQKPYEIGTLAVEAAYQYFIEGKEVPKRMVPGFFFTKDNVDDPESQKYIYRAD